MRRSQLPFLFAVCVAIPAAAIVVGAFNSKANQPVRLARVDGVTMYVPVSIPETHSAAAADTNGPIGTPRAEVSEREFNFGVVEPMRAHRHTFEIHNGGTAPLRISRLGTSCKCLEVEVIDRIVAAGETGALEVTWEALPTQDVFLQRATIETNDPANAKIDLKIAGQVRVIVGADPPTLAVPRIKPNQQAHATTLVVSQVWDAFTIDDLKSSLEGLTWSLSPADPQELDRLKARSGWRLAVTFPADMPTGSFKETLTFTARPAASALHGDATEPLTEPLARDIPLEGTVLRRLAVYGKDIQPWGTIEAGTIDPARGYAADYLLKVNDDQLDLATARIETSPSFVEAQVKPYGSAGKPGLYRLRLHIPPGGEPGVYHGDRQGKITVTFDHPRIKSLDLGIEFIVLQESHDRLSASRRTTPGGS